MARKTYGQQFDDAEIDAFCEICRKPSLFRKVWREGSPVQYEGDFLIRFCERDHKQRFDRAFRTPPGEAQPGYSH